MAAEIVAGALLSASLDVLLDRLTHQFLNFTRGKKLDNNLLHRLKPTLNAARAVLSDAELKQIRDSAVREWLDDLKDAVYDADDLIDEISTKAASRNQVCNFSSDNLYVHDREMGNKLEAVTNRLEFIVNRKDVLGLKMSVSGNLSWRVHSTSLVKAFDVYGREKDKEVIIKLLLDDNDKLAVIPIVGMGGIGKTTLVQLVYNDEHVKQKFDLRAWVCVSEAFDILRITKTIVEAVTFNDCNKTDLNLLQLDLKEKLSGKKFLLVLDDVWNENYIDWDTLMNPFHYGKEGSKILVTTCSERVASMVKTTPSFYSLGLLYDEDCLALFARHAFHSNDSTSNSYLEKIHKDIASKCKGLPLAAKALGGLFWSKPDIKFWNTILKSDVWYSTENEIIPALKVSYHYLPPHLKQCFVYCSIFPEDYEFNKKTLILMWMAEGFLQPSKGGMTLEEVGNEYFDDLTSRSFFQPSCHKDECFVMHDLIHDLATSIAGDFCCRSKVGEGRKISSRTRHLSYKISRKISSNVFEDFKSVKALRTFLGLSLERIPGVVGSALHTLLSNLKYLRLLSLVGFKALRGVPDSIGELINLRYLDLSGTRIENLPNSLCKSYNLQTLKLRFCYNLKMLPSDMQDLVNLRYLDTRDTPLKEMPRGMSKLKNLQFLSDFIVGKEQGTKIGELGKIPNLKDWLCIRKLENIRNSNEAYEARMMEKKHIEVLHLSWSSADCVDDSQTERDILDKLQAHWGLKRLSINAYRGTVFPAWLGSHSYYNMTKLQLHDCNNCCMLPPLGQLPSLKTLYIKGFNSMVSIGVEFYMGNGCSSVTPFASLETLWFNNMSAWEKWCSIKMEAFPKLRGLKISNCRKLTGDLPCQLLSLEVLQVQRCPLLGSSIPRCPEIQKLDILGSEQVVLQELPHSLCYVRISGCRQVESMFEAMACSENFCLQSLRLEDCSSAILLHVIYLPPSVKNLTIYNCKQLEFPKQQLHMSLESLLIYNSCDTLTSFPAETFPNVEDLYIEQCENLSSVLVSNTPLQNLHLIYILDCKNLKSLSNNTYRILPNLKRLCIRNCPEIEAFPKGFLPPSLSELEISYCDKLFAHRNEWHLPNLTCLCIIGKHHSIKRFPEVGLLPSTLITLKLSKFSSLETLDCRGLQHLTSLQELAIFNSPKLQKMAGEMLPASLIKIRIQGCDLLEKQCCMKYGEIWPKISHIPAIYLSYGLISQDTII